MGKALNILIVEDDFISRTLLSEMLAPFGVCQFATNGKDAVKILESSFYNEKSFFDLVCIDIVMPEMNGHQVLRELRLIEYRKEIDRKRAAKVLMISALDDAKNIMEALVVGKCEGYMTKPVSRRGLEDQLRILHLVTNGLTHLPELIEIN